MRAVLRALIHESLLQEASITDFANRMLGHVGIVLGDYGSRVKLVAVSMAETETASGGVIIPKVLGFVDATVTSGKNSGKYYRITQLYADDPVISMTLLSAALEHYKRVLTDHSVSTAAQQVIKRYYDRNKDDPSRVEIDGDFDRKSKDPDFLRAAYLGPVGFDISRAFELGDSAAEKASRQAAKDIDEVHDAVMDAGRRKFYDAHDDNVKTRRTLDDLLNHNLDDLVMTLASALKGSNDDHRDKAIAWMKTNSTNVRDALEGWKFGRQARIAWDEFVEPSL
jgi:very-short-patch-repair endonuclease